jgi:hypothetical protein
MLHKKVTFPCQDIILDGVLAIPEGEGPFGLVVICHPHPLYGGSMHNKVIYAVSRQLEEKGLAWLKFNFRGVGFSGGSFAGGVGEREDARAAIAFGGVQEKIDHEKIGICGYSFGAAVAFGVAGEDSRIKAVAGISPPLHPAGPLPLYKKPKLIVSGADDELIHPKDLEEIFRILPEPKELIFYPEADHFWGASDGPMAEKVSLFFLQNL